MMRTKFLASAAGVLAAAILISGIGASLYRVQGEEPAVKSLGERPDKAKGPDAEPAFSFQAFEGFHGKLLLNWQPVRSDPTHVSLTKHPGALTITTQRGTIHGDANLHGEPFAKNIFVLPNPLGKDADFVMTTCVSNFTPTQSYQQAALICYNDDDNYLKWSYEFHGQVGSGQYFVLVREIEAKPEHFSTDGVSGLKKVWLRLTKRGKSYEYATSIDGKGYEVRGEQEWGDGGPKMLGILAKNGGPEGVPEIEAQFGFFELTSPAPARDGEKK